MTNLPCWQENSIMDRLTTIAIQIKCLNSTGSALFARIQKVLFLPGPVLQLVVSLIADPGVMSLILAEHTHTFMEIDREIFSRVLLHLLSYKLI